MTKEELLKGAALILAGILSTTLAVYMPNILENLTSNRQLGFWHVSLLSYYVAVFVLSFASIVEFFRPSAVFREILSYLSVALVLGSIAYLLVGWRVLPGINFLVDVGNVSSEFPVLVIILGLLIVAKRVIEKRSY